MTTRNFLKTTIFAALAVAPLVAMTSHSASAQQVVAATCPSGYELSGSSCVRPPKPTCPTGYVFNKGQCVAGRMEATRAVQTASTGPWAFITREAFGVAKAKELDGANFCAVKDSPSADAATKFFEDNDLEATHVKVDNERAGIETYQKYDCDVLVVSDSVATSTADSLKPKGDHIVLPEKLASLEPAPAKPVAAPVQPTVKPVVTPAPKPVTPPATVTKKPAPKKVAKKPVQRKPRCSAIRYAYSSGGTCACAGPRVFTGRACVRPRWY